MSRNGEENEAHLKLASLLAPLYFALYFGSFDTEPALKLRLNPIKKSASVTRSFRAFMSCVVMIYSSFR